MTDTLRGGAVLTGRELDAAVAERVMGLPMHEGLWFFDPKARLNVEIEGEWRGIRAVPFYSASIANAWDVVETMIEKGWLPQVGHCGGFGWRAEFWTSEPEFQDAVNVSDSPAVAICRAALRALDASTSHPEKGAVEPGGPDK